MSSFPFIYVINDNAVKNKSMVFDSNGNFTFAIDTSDINKFLSETLKDYVIINPIEKSTFNQPHEVSAIFKINKYFNSIYKDNSPVIDSASYYFDVFSYILKDYDIVNKKVLDFGGGNNRYSCFFKKSYYTSYDIDLSYSKEDILKKNYYDFVICNFVLEHVANPFSILETLSSCLKEKGKLIISIPILTFYEYFKYVLLNSKLSLPIFHFRTFSISNSNGCLSIFEIMKKLRDEDIKLLQSISLKYAMNEKRIIKNKPFSFFGNQLTILGEKN